MSYLPENLQNDPTVKSIVASPEYQGASNLERFNILETGINAYNQALYESTGRERVLIDLPGTMFDIGRKRVQDAEVFNPDTGEFDKRTYTVPTPEDATLWIDL